MIPSKRKAEPNAQRGKDFFIKTAIFFLYCIQFAIRDNFSLCIIPLTDAAYNFSTSAPTYSWTNVGVLLSAFYWTYGLSQVFARRFRKSFGMKKLLFLSMFVNTLSCLLMPAAAQYTGSYGIFLLRSLQGLFQGFLVPNTGPTEWNIRFPKDNLSPVFNFLRVYGQSFGSISLVTTGFLLISPLGWPAPFYLSGICGGIWCLLWILYFDEDSNDTKGEEPVVTEGKIVWSAVFRSLPFWGIIIAAIGEHWMYTYFSTLIPTYLSYTFPVYVDDKKCIWMVGLLLYSSYLVAGIGPAVFLYWPLLSEKYHIISKTNSRRLFQCVIVSAHVALWLTISYTTKDGPTVMLLLLANVTHGIYGQLINHLDHSPKHGATLTEVSNGIAQTVAAFAPVAVQLIVHDFADSDQWRISTLCTTALVTATTMFYVIYCSTQKQKYVAEEDNDGEQCTKTHQKIERTIKLCPNAIILDIIYI